LKERKRKRGLAKSLKERKRKRGFVKLKLLAQIVNCKRK